MNLGDMMTLKIHGKIPDDIELKVRLNNDVKELTSVLNNETFFVSEKGNYEIYIEQKALERRYNLLDIFLYIITIFFRGIIHMLLMDIESEWYKDVSAYCLNAKITVNVQDDVEIHFKYHNSELDNDGKTWKLPCFNLEEHYDYDISYSKNPIDIKNKFLDYAKKFSSVVSVNLCMFSYLLCVSFSNGIRSGILITIIILCAIILIWSLVIFHEYKRCKKLYRNFVENK